MNHSEEMTHALLAGGESNDHNGPCIHKLADELT